MPAAVSDSSGLIHLSAVSRLDLLHEFYARSNSNLLNINLKIRSHAIVWYEISGRDIKQAGTAKKLLSISIYSNQSATLETLARARSSA
jgi:hypothetical protein